MDEILKEPTRPLEIDPADTVAELLRKMGGISFQGRNLSRALDVWSAMLEDRVLIFFGLSGAMTAGGMRNIVKFLIRNRYIDCLVSTGANLFHDAHESLGRKHYIGDHMADDAVLAERKIDRIYDTYVRESEFCQLDDWIADWAYRLDLDRSYSTREFLHLLGKKVDENKEEDGILTSAYRSGVPIFCPAIADSSIGIALSNRPEGERRFFKFDVIKDVWESAYIVDEVKHTGVIYIGGGTPKNFIQQAEVTAVVVSGIEAPGHKYAIQITADAPHWGGLSGCTFQEAQSWGKIHKHARMVTTFADATLALPFLVTALAQRHPGNPDRRAIPKFEFGEQLKVSFQ